MAGRLHKVTASDSTLDTIAAALKIAEAHAFGADSRENFAHVGRTVAAWQEKADERAPAAMPERSPDADPPDAGRREQ